MEPQDMVGSERRDFSRDVAPLNLYIYVCERSKQEKNQTI